MTFSFNVFSSKTPFTEPEPRQLKHLAQNLDGTFEYQNLLNLPDFTGDSTRNLSEIMVDVKARKFGSISDIEWIYLVFSKADWDETVSANEVKLTAAATWEAASNKPLVLSYLVWMLALSYSRQNALAQSLVDQVNFSLLSNRLPEKTSKLLRFLSQEAYAEIAQEACRQNQSPKVLFESCKLPGTQEAIGFTLNQSVLGFKNSDLQENRSGSWLISCFEDMSDDLQVKQVTLLLSHIDSRFSNFQPSLTAWLRQHYWHRSPQSRWNRLNSAAQKSLKLWIHAASWQDFQNLINTLVRQLEQKQELYPNNPKIPQQINQLKRRKEFWSNYSQCFERLRILVPQESNQFVKGELRQDIDVLVSDQSDPTEVCIFDFGEKYVIEFFRGRGSEMRSLAKGQNPHVEKRLFEDNNLSICSLRKLGGDKHDHVYLWQAYAERWLRERGISPNEGIRIWRGIPRQYAQYRQGVGLDLPPMERRQTRERNLQQWRNTMDLIENNCQNSV
jgi:hypothetical protein